MGHVFFRQGRLKLAAILPVTILWLAFAGGAHAAIPFQDTINTATHPSTAWDGNIYPAGVAQGDPQFCPPGTANDALCDHFELTTTNAGAVRVAATWPSDSPTSQCTTTMFPCDTDPTFSDFDVLVCDNSVIDQGELDPMNLLGTSPPPDNCVGGTQVAYFPGNTVGFSGGSFVAQANKTYEIRVIPVFTLDGSDYKGCAEYTSVTVRSCAVPPPVVIPPVDASQFFAGCAPDGDKQRQLDGGGTIPSLAASTKKANFSINVRRSFDSKGKRHFRGKVNYSDDHLAKFRSQQGTCASFTDGTNTRDDDHSTTFRGSVELRGFGKLQDDSNGNNWRLVCFKATGEDWGQPGAGKDKFRIDLYEYNQTAQTCSSTPVYTNSNVITSGNEKYKFRPEGGDDNESDDDGDGHEWGHKD